MTDKTPDRGDTLVAYRQIRRFEIVSYLLIGFMFVSVLLPESWDRNYLGLSVQETQLFFVALIAVLITRIGTTLVHEAYEINDQLAGRSPELHEALS